MNMFFGALAVKDISHIYLKNHILAASIFIVIVLFTFQDSQPHSRSGSLSHFRTLFLTLNESDTTQDIYHHVLKCDFHLAYSVLDLCHTFPN